jgi:hypothetical protein
VTIIFSITASWSWLICGGRRRRRKAAIKIIIMEFTIHKHHKFVNI